MWICEAELGSALIKTSDKVAAISVHVRDVSVLSTRVSVCVFVPRTKTQAETSAFADSDILVHDFDSFIFIY